MTKFMGIVLPKTTQITHNLFGQSANLSKSAKTFRTLLKKKPYWASVVRASEAVRFLDLLIWS